jgi:hypothetical protein
MIKIKIIEFRVTFKEVKKWRKIVKKDINIEPFIITKNKSSGPWSATL